MKKKPDLKINGLVIKYANSVGEVDLVYWLGCPPCLEHFNAHELEENEGGNGIELTDLKEECCFELDGCWWCGKSHDEIRNTQPDNPCDSAFMKEIST